MMDPLRIRAGRMERFGVPIAEAGLNRILTAAIDHGDDPLDLTTLARSLGFSDGFRRELTDVGYDADWPPVIPSQAYYLMLGDQLHFARAHLADILSGRVAAHDEALCSLAARHTAPAIDVTTARLVASLGVRPLAAAAMAALASGEIDLLPDDGGGDPGIRLSATHPAGHAWCRSFVRIAPDVKWQAAGMLRLRSAVPAAITAAMPGRPLAAIVSHPVLDLENHVVRGVTTDAGGRLVIRLRTDHGLFAATDDYILAAGRPGTG